HTGRRRGVWGGERSLCGVLLVCLTATICRRGATVTKARGVLRRSDQASPRPLRRCGETTLTRRLAWWEGRAIAYLRVSIGSWSIDLTSEEGQAVFRQIEEEGLTVFHQQPGFIRYRLMHADAHTTVAVAEWESEELGRAGAERFREWLRSSGIMRHLALHT